MRYMVRYLGRFLKEHARALRAAPRSLLLALHGNYLVLVYLLVKLVYIGNAIGQLFLLNAFLGTDYHLYGIDVLRRMATGEVVAQPCKD